ncbi:sporulation protein YqfD [Virgibacillus sp. LDC-1]|uniref:sporulation protein YqfD n=1 Tax=Virgibacillus sp. LDC-1 TaxID=3039856 RepID=UPI0024DE541D|nr:sporulation protein YqfD [Virgibacillus sp. LDC-1]
MKHTQGKFLSGYVTILVKGNMPELFFQKCVEQGISVWNVRKKGVDSCVGNVKLSDIHAIKQIKRRGNYRISFIGRKGFPFLFHRFIKRKEVLFGLLIGIFAIIFLSNIIWKVDINGLPKEIEEKVVKQLESYGIHQGAWTLSLGTPSDIQKKLMRDVPELLWIGVQKKGTTFQLEGVEKLIVKEDKVKGPRHLVATKKGTIKKMYISKGVPQVAVNDFVKPGDVLVSGVLNQSEENNKEKDKNKVFVASEGQVIANTWYEVAVSIPLEAKYEVLTGKQEKRYYMGINDFQVPIWGFKTPEYADIFVEQNENPIYFLKWKLPFQFIESSISEKTYHTTKRTKEEAIQIGIEQAKQELVYELGPDAKVISEKVLHVTTERGKVNLELYLTVEEDIVKEVPIQKNSKDGD